MSTIPHWKLWRAVVLVTFTAGWTAIPLMHEAPAYTPIHWLGNMAMLLLGALIMFTVFMPESVGAGRSATKVSLFKRRA